MSIPNTRIGCEAGEGDDDADKDDDDRQHARHAGGVESDYRGLDEERNGRTEHEGAQEVAQKEKDRDRDD